VAPSVPAEGVAGSGVESLALGLGDAADSDGDGSVWGTGEVDADGVLWLALGLVEDEGVALGVVLGSPSSEPEDASFPTCDTVVPVPPDSGCPLTRS
jgi:hypothetical protein